MILTKSPCGSLTMEVLIDLNDPNVQEQLINMMSQLRVQPQPSLQLPDGIDQFPQLAPMNQYNNLVNELPFESFKWRTGKDLPRMVCQLSNSEIQQYPILSSMIHSVLQNHPLFQNVQIGSAWINHYRDGTDWTPYHQDSYNSSVMMISLGTSRTLLTKDMPKYKGEKVPRAKSWQCGDGDIVVFTPEWNDNHQHSVPKRPKVDTGRISIVLFLS